MVSPFDRIPQEVLDRIILYAVADDKESKYKLQLVNKLWYSAAEKYVYEELDLRKLNNYPPTLRSYETLFGSHRSKLVKTLYISFNDMPVGGDGRVLPLDDNFFKVFPNINRVHRCNEDNDEDNDAEFWLCFKDSFTSKRCQLKELDQVKFLVYQGYLDAMLDHAHTLEILYLLKVNLLRIKETAVFFPNVKELTIEKNCWSLQDLDDVLSKCPALESLDVSIGDGIYEDEDTSLWIEKLLPKQQHKRHMRSIRVYYHYHRDLPFICSYLTAKFPDVQQWILNTSVLEDADLPAPVDVVITFFEEIDGYLRHMAKSKEAKFQFRAYCNSSTEAFDFLFDLSQPHGWDVTITYDQTEGDNLDELLDKNNDTDIVFRRVWYNSIPRANGRDHVEIKCLSERFQHLDVLEKIGRHIKALNVFNESLEEEKPLAGRDSLSVLLDSCPELTLLDFTIRCNSLERIATTPVHYNLKNMTLMSRFIHQELLLDLSTRAPNITDMTILLRGPRTEHEETIINMPHNCFEQLTIQLGKATEEQSLVLHVTTVKFVLLEKDIERYFIQLIEEGERNKRECDEEEYLRFHQLPDSTKITVICKSFIIFNYLDTHTGRSSMFFS